MPFITIQIEISTEEMFLAASLPYRIGKSVCDNSSIARPVDVTGLQPMSDAVRLLSDFGAKVSDETVSVGDEDSILSSSQSDISVSFSVRRR